MLVVVPCVGGLIYLFKINPDACFVMIAVLFVAYVIYSIANAYSDAPHDDSEERETTKP